jgi:acid phosphatase family membrane protein YuiD
MAVISAATAVRRKTGARARWIDEVMSEFEIFIAL